MYIQMESEKNVLDKCYCDYCDHYLRKKPENSQAYHFW